MKIKISGMGFKTIQIKLPTHYSDAELHSLIAKNLKIKDFSYRIDTKSLDARNKSNIHWELQVAVSSPELSGGEEPSVQTLKIPRTGRNARAVVVGSGPAGFFAAFVLQKAGFRVHILERGKDINAREKGITDFESSGHFDPLANYAFGEGGAGTFSDGKLTSRSKRISTERQFITDTYISAGAPPEIAYMNHPHLGSDNLRKMTRVLREMFEEEGGTLSFETCLVDLLIEKEKVLAAVTDKGTFEASYFILGTGHSAFETFRMLMKRGVQFRPKNFAIGSRMEHPRQIINKAQWGKEELPGVKAAEYRLTANPDGKLPVYSFCMCPGGIIVPATAYANNNIVNGMSLYNRDMPFSNAACVAAVDPFRLIGENVSAARVLDWLEALEIKFYEKFHNYHVPFCSVKDFMERKEPGKIPESSYPLGLTPAPLWEFLPGEVQNSIREGLKEFCRKMKGFDTGIIMGLESKTSAPIQVIREEDGKCTGFSNLYMVGEGSGYAGGIISSGADGVKTALKICHSRT
jgi:uncharacterized FAD-dependent dehydrogenase